MVRPCIGRCGMILERWIPSRSTAPLLRAQLPELVLRPGMRWSRVLAAGRGSPGVLVLAGAPLKAELPEEVQAGDTLRLTVLRPRPSGSALRLEKTPPAPAPPPTAALGRRPVRGRRRGAAAAAGAAARGRRGRAPRRRRRAGSPAPPSRLSYESPALGRLDLRLERGPEGVSVVVGAPAGSFGLAQERAEALREALETRLDTQASVRIAPRREPFDAYA